MFKNKKYLFIIGAMVSVAVVLTLPFISKQVNNKAFAVFCESYEIQQDCVGDYCFWYGDECHTTTCGNGLCDMDEDYLSCVTDCDLCPDGMCNNGEDLFTCPADCSNICGNGFTEEAEQCDDYNIIDGDGCTSSCITEFCGDGIVNNSSSEECDDGPANSDSNPDACRTNCQPAECGDNVIDTGEDCDPPNGFTCDLSCLAIHNYYWEAGEWSPCDAPCGEGTQTSVVVCKDGLDIIVDDSYCMPLSPKPETTQPCSNQPCEFCGNGIAEGVDPVFGGGFGEPCDGTDLRSYTCETLPGEFTGGILSCNGDCMSFDTTLCTSGGGGGGGCTLDPACDAPCGAGPSYSPDAGQTCFSDDQCANICQMEPKPAFIFITSGLGNGNTAGIAGANGACMGAAITAGLDGTWKALISGINDPPVNAADTLPDKPYFLLNGIQVAENKADLLDGTIMNPVYITEYGTPYNDFQGHPGLAWTGSDASGNFAVVPPYADLSCANWTSGVNGSRAIAGLANTTDANWIDGIPENDGAMHCDQQVALYCVSGDSTGMGEPEIICDDGIDNNRNGKTDCADSQCSRMPICGGQGGQCINMDGILDGTDPFAGGQGEACDGTAFWPEHDTCEAFGYTGGTLGCTICKPDFSQCTGGGGQMGMGQITVNLKDEDGNPYDYDGEGGGSGVAENTFVVAACGNTTVQMPEGAGGQGGPAPTQSDSFYSGAMIEAGNSSATIMGIPTPRDGEIFSEPCLIFLGQSSNLTLGSQYIYSGGLDDPEVWTDYSRNTNMDKPMPPMAKYAQVYLGDPSSNNMANLNIKVQELTPGNLTGYICFDLDGNGVCTPPNGINEMLAGMQISIFPIGNLSSGTTLPDPYTTDESGYYEFNNLPGGSYIIEAFGPKMYIGTVEIKGGDQVEDLVIGLGGTLELTLDNTLNGDGCWNEDIVRYSFWPQNWNFNSRPVFGEAAFIDFTDNDDGTYTIGIQGFSKETYNGYIEIPGCLNINDAVVDSSELTEVLSAGVTVSGRVVTDPNDPDNTGVADFDFGARTVWDSAKPNVFGGVVGTGTDPDGNFELSGLSAGDWNFESFEGGSSSQRSFASGQGSLDADGVYTVTGDASDLILVLRSDKRVNITVSDGINLVTNAMIDIKCNTGKYIHLGHSNGVYTFLPPGDICEFNVHARSGSYQPLNDYPVTILTGLQPQNVSLVLNSYNDNLGSYTGSTFKSDKTTANPGGTVNYTGHVYSPNAANLAGKTVTFTYPAGSADSIAALPTVGTCNTATDGIVTCAIPGGYADTSFDVNYALTIDTAYQENSLSAGFSIDGTNIGNVFVEVTKLTINAPSAVGTGDTFTVYGSAYPDSTVTLSYIDSDGAETSVGQTIMEPGSTWYSFSGVQIGNADEYTLKATAVGEGVSAFATRMITVGGDTPHLAGITMTVNGERWQNSEYTGIPTGQIFEGTPFTVNLSFNKAVTSVTGAFAGLNYPFEAAGMGSWKVDVPAGWTGYGELTFDVTVTWDDDDDPATPDITVPLGTGASLGGLIDPSGYVYDTVDSNRIDNVTSTIYQLVDGDGNPIAFVDGADDGTGAGIADNGIIENDEELMNSGSVLKLNDGTTDCTGGLNIAGCHWSSWDAAPSGQVNPQLTDVNGKYGWNVPVGWFRVSFTKAGEYSTSYSRDVYVPPAETTLNLNIGAYDIAAPTADTNPAHGATGVARNVSPTVLFSEPMLAGTINTTNIKLLDADNANAEVGITVTYDSGNNTATLAPVAPPLAGNNNYIIRITTGVTDDSSNALAAQVDNGFQTSAVTDIVAPTSAATPTGTAFTSAQSPFAVTLGADDGGGVGTCTDCVIHYTTDGTAPTTSSSVYSAPFALTATTTIKFFAKDAAGNSEAPANSETYTLTTAPAVPTGFAGGSLTNGCSLNWDDMLSATSYKVYRSTTSGSGYALLASPATSLYADYAVTGGTPYYYKVSAVNVVGESGLSAEVSVTPLAAGQQQEVVTGGGGGGTTNVNIPADSNTATNSIPTTLADTVNTVREISRTIKLSGSMLTTIGDTISATLTGPDGSITFKPNENSTITAFIPAGTTVTGNSEWDGLITPPIIKSETMINLAGEPVAGTDFELTRDNVLVIVKLGSTESTLTFSKEVTMEIPVDAPDGTKAYLYFSDDGNNWEKFNGGIAYIVMNGKVTVNTDHFTYYAVAEAGEYAPGGPFTDVFGHWAESYINQIYTLGIVSGKSATTFAPDDAITRAELTKIALKAFGYTVGTTVETAPFKDVATNAWYAPYVAAAKDSGVINGYVDGSFKPNANVNRAEALKILLEAAKSQVDPNGKVAYSDITPNSWYMKYVAYATNNGIVQGYGNSLFGPERSITRAEVAKVVNLIMAME